MDTINQRLKDFFYYKRIKQITASKMLGINNQQLNGWCNNTKPTLEGIQTILNHFPELSAKWLLCGTGDMIVKEEIIDVTDEIDLNGILSDYGELLTIRDSAINEVSPFIERKTNKNILVKQIKAAKKGSVMSAAVKTVSPECQ